MLGVARAEGGFEENVVEVDRGRKGAEGLEKRKGKGEGKEMGTNGAVSKGEKARKGIGEV